jgi:formate hydrogenlyase subunit 4
MNWAGWLAVIAHTGLFVLAAPLYAGWIKRNKALLKNRRPASILQPYRDLRKLFSKEVVLADSATVIFRIAPYVVVGATALAVSILPLIVVGLPVNAMADAIVLVGLLALGRFFLALAGMDIGTTFGGMGSSREMMIGSLAEPAMLMVIFTLAMVVSSTNLSTVVMHFMTTPFALRPSIFFALIALTMVAIAETGRIPVDNPATHLELTMIHEAMILEYSGRHLAMMEFASQLKLLLYSVLIVNLFFPWGISTTYAAQDLALAALALTIKLTVVGALLAAGETVVAKMRVFRVPTYLAIAFTVALVGMLSFVILESG